jgi:formylglycine-generating enzyme required for sulfatase activity
LQELDLLEVLPEKDMPVVKWQHRDDAYLSIVKGLKTVLRVPEEAFASKLEDKKQHIEAEVAARKKRELQDHSTFHLAKTREDFEDYLKRGFTQYAQEAKERIAIIKKQEAIEKKKLENNEADPFAHLMIHIKGGTYEMGDTFGDGGDSEKPIHRVTVKDFYLCKYPVTQAQFFSFLSAKCGENGRDFLTVQSS